MVDLEKIKEKKSTKQLLDFGIINIDKSSGPTSFKISEFAGKKLGIKKTSHFGTLDPKVTGVLPVALGRGVKLSGYFMGLDKEYVGSMRLHQDIEKEKIESKIKEKFTGKITQTPPAKSRVRREPRERYISEFKILEKEGQNVLFCVKCQGGTYVRKLIDDLGQELEVGAHMLELRRTKAGIFGEDSIVKLQDFEKAVEEYKKGNGKRLREMVFPAEVISEAYPVLQVHETEVGKLYRGKPIYKKDVVVDHGWKKDSLVSVFAGNRFIGMYKIFRGKDIFAISDYVCQPIDPKPKKGPKKDTNKSPLPKEKDN